MNRRAVVTVAALLAIGATAVTGYLARNQEEIARAKFEEQRAEYEQVAWSNLRLGLEHKGKFVRVEAAGRLALLGDASGWPVLLRSLRDPNPATRQAAAIALAPFGSRALPEIRNILETDESFVRERAFSALGYMGDEESRAMLLAEYASPTHVNMRTVVQSLWLAMPEFAVDETVSAFESGRMDHAQTMLFSWQQFRPDCPRRHGQKCGELESRLLEGLGRLAEADGEPAERAKSASAQLRRVASPARLEAEQLTSAIEKLNSKDENIRWEAAQVLSHAAPDDALPAISEALQDEDGDRVRNALFKILIQRRPDLATEHAVRAVTDGGVSARTTTSEYLREYPHPALVPAYEAALQSPHGYVRLAAVEALNEIVHPDRDRLLAQAFADSDPRVIVLASAALLRQ